MSAGPPGARSFPRRSAATQRFTLGAPRTFALSPDGGRVIFVRSRGGDDSVGCLWVLHVASGEERCVADPRSLGVADGDLPPEERARRERARESASGIVTYATDRDVTLAVFALGAGAYVADLGTGDVCPLPVAGPVVAPRLDPTGTYVAFVRAQALWVCARDGTGERQVCGEDDPLVSWGLPEFVAAEEMGRMRGYWWAPDGRRLAVARVDETAVRRWHIGDPVDPVVPPVEHRYPAAGTPNADVSLHVVSLEGTSTVVAWDRQALPYLVDVSWRVDEPLTVVAQSRDQQRLQILTAAEDGSTAVVGEHRQQPWVDLAAGFPRWGGDGRLIDTVEAGDTRRIAVAGRPVTPDGLHVRRLIDATPQRLVFSASGDDPTAVVVWSCTPDGEKLQPLSATDGVADAVAAGETTIIVQRGIEEPGATVTVHRAGRRHRIPSHAEIPDVALNLSEVVLGERQLRGVLLLPAGHEPDGHPLPVLLDPYGGPHVQRVLRSYNAYLESQWFADAGFAVLVIDGRGSPGR
ncbi:MAG: S9 family peptidase, partial [Nitriliruptorales bacterium]|nr:S9 family peptidase [Nitriliruptorales bacterium]